VAKAHVSEIGYAQSTPFYGATRNWWVYDPEETTPELQWPESIAVFDQMRKQDSQVGSVLEAVCRPILATPWRLDPAKARDEVVEWVADDLGLPIVGREDPEPPLRSRDRFSWLEHVELALLMLPFGHMFFEQLYQITDDAKRAHLHKLGPRMPRTIEHVDVAPDGGLISITQYSSMIGKKQKPIPVKHLVAYVYKKEGANWLGRSILRQAYKNWLIKDRLLRVQAQTIERNGMGIPLYIGSEITATKSEAAEAEMDRGNAMAQAWRSGEAAGSAVPFGANLRLVGVEGQLPDALPVVKYHDEQIARAVLAHFLNLDSQSHGSYALGASFMDFFTQSLQTLAAQIATTASMHIVEDLVDTVWGEKEPAPRIVFDEIGSRQAATAQAVKMLIDSGVIQPDDVLEQSERQRYGLPPKDKETTRDTGSDNTFGGGDDDTLAGAIDAYSGEADEAERVEAAGKFRPDLHPRDTEGKFRETFTRIISGLRRWAASGGKGDPFQGFDGEQLHDVATKVRGLKFGSKPSRKEVSRALLGDLREELDRKMPSTLRSYGEKRDKPAAKAPAKPAEKPAAKAPVKPAAKKAPEPDPSAPMNDAEFQARMDYVESTVGDAMATHATDVLYTDGLGVWTPERDALHRTIAAELYARYDHVPSEGKAIISGGLGGAGKTTVLKGHAGLDLDQYVMVNADDIKEILAERGLIPEIPGAPDLSPMERSSLIHEESSRISKMLAELAYHDRKNVVWDITMSSEGSVAKRLDELRRNMYTDIHGVFIDIPAELSVSRALARYRDGADKYRAGEGLGGRYVPPRVIRASVAPGGAGTKNRGVFDTLRPRFETWELWDTSSGKPVKVDEGHGPPTKRAYIDAAMENLTRTSRTATGTVDTSASPDKAAQMSGVSGDAAAKLAQENYRLVLGDLYGQRQRQFDYSGELRDFVENVVRAINHGILKPGVLYREHDSDKYPNYTRVADLPAAARQFFDELQHRMNTDRRDPVETAAWIEYRMNLTDHFWADGVGKTSSALAAFVLMRRGHALPTYSADRKEQFAHAPKRPRSAGREVDDAQFADWLSYYRTLFEDDEKKTFPLAFERGGGARQAKIDRARPVAETLARLDEMVDGEMSPAAIERTIRADGRRHGLPQTTVDDLVAAGRSGGRDRVNSVTDRLAAEHGLSRYTARAGELEAFDRKKHELLDGGGTPTGTFVHIVRPGYEADIDGERVRLGRATAEPATAEEIAAHKAKTTRAIKRAPTRKATPWQRGKWTQVTAADYRAERAAQIATEGVASDAHFGLESPAGYHEGLGVGIALREAPPGSVVLTNGPQRVLVPFGRYPIGRSVTTDDELTPAPYRIPEAVAMEAADVLDTLIETQPPPKPIRIVFTGHESPVGKASTGDAGTEIALNGSWEPNEKQDNGSGFASWFMPVARDSSTTQVRYHITHEYGHVLMFQHGHGGAAHSAREANKDTLSPYGKTDYKEAYAEAFAEWSLSGGRTDNPAAIDYARKFGWAKPGRAPRKSMAPKKAAPKKAVPKARIAPIDSTTVDKRLRAASPGDRRRILAESVKNQTQARKLASQLGVRGTSKSSKDDALDKIVAHYESPGQYDRARAAAIKKATPAGATPRARRAKGPRPSGLPTGRRLVSGDFDDLADRISLGRGMTEVQKLEIFQDLNATELSRLAAKFPGGQGANGRTVGLKLPTALSLDNKRKWLAKQLSEERFHWRLAMRSSPASEDAGGGLGALGTELGMAESGQSIRASLRKVRTPKGVATVTARELEEIMGRPVDVSFRGMDTQMAREASEALLRAAQVFPNNRLRAIRTYGAVEADELFHRGDPTFDSAALTTTGAYGDNDDIMYFNIVGGPQYYRMQLEMAGITEFQAAPTVAGVATHEFGHIVTVHDEQITQDALAIVRRHASVVGTNEVAFARSEISGYGATEPHEMVAEAFSDVMMNGDAASDLSHEIFATIQANYDLHGASRGRGPGQLPLWRLEQAGVRDLFARAEAGGFTYSVSDHEYAVTGFAVSPYPKRSRVIPFADFTPDAIDQYERDNADLLAKPGHYLGAWREIDGDTDQVWLDVSIVAQDEAEGARIGREFDQVSMFNLGTFETVDLGGTGGQGSADVDLPQEVRDG